MTYVKLTPAQKQRRVGPRRLKKLGTALLKQEETYGDQLLFDFRVVQAKNYRTQGCGTSGCAIGHCPLVFPRDWKVYKDVNSTYDLTVSLADDPPYQRGQWLVATMKFFNLTEDEALRLFHPNKAPLPFNPTAAQVGQHILDFVAKELA